MLAPPASWSRHFQIDAVVAISFSHQRFIDEQCTHPALRDGTTLLVPNQSLITSPS